MALRDIGLTGARDDGRDAMTGEYFLYPVRELWIVSINPRRLRFDVEGSETSTTLSLAKEGKDQESENHGCCYAPNLISIDEKMSL